VTLEEVPDHVRQYTPEEEETLTRHLLALTEKVDRGDFSNESIAPRLLCTLHRALFDSVRDHAGKIRKRGFGSERLTFGPHRSDARDDVPEKLDKTLEEARTMLASLLARPEDPTYEMCALHIAVWVHAKVIRIHPFEDGNGRTSRLLMGIILVGAGLRQIPVEVCKQEYLDCLNHYFNEDEIEPLLDLLLRVDLGYV